MTWFTWSPLELWANIFTIACIVLAGRNSIHTWWTGLVGCVLFIFLFCNVQLYADATLQIFFFATGVIGWIAWRNKKEVKELPIGVANKEYMVVAVGTAVAVALAYGWLLHTFTNAYAPWIDSTVLAFSVVAQLLLMSRSIQTWKVWLIVNTLSVPLFWSRELYLTSVLYGFFWVNAAVSYFNWKKLMEKQNA
jgi:nicotinamide mononucleotide transporter